MSETVVLKFGGTALSTPSRLRRAAARIRYCLRHGERPVVVVSARGRATDGLVRTAARVGMPGLTAETEMTDETAGHDSALQPAVTVCEDPLEDALTGACEREFDRLLATGEDRAAALLAIACARLGVPARSLRGGEAGIRAAGAHARGRICAVDTTSLHALLAEGTVPIISGFQGIRADGETLTLGRGGSDTTAVVLADALGPVPCHIITDVPAVYDRDPTAWPDAAPFEVLDHAALVALAEAGAQVMSPEAARLAERYHVPLRIYDFRAPINDEVGGTRVGSTRSENTTPVTAWEAK